MKSKKLTKLQNKFVDCICLYCFLILLTQQLNNWAYTSPHIPLAFTLPGSRKKLSMLMRWGISSKERTNTPALINFRPIHSSCVRQIYRPNVTSKECAASKQCDQKNRQMSIKVVQKWFHYKNDRFWHLHKNCLRIRGDLAKLIVAKGF